jgi:hypothetical protein
MTAINITAYTNDASQIDAIKAVLQAFKIKFEIGTEKPYNPEFVAKVLQGDEDIKAGKGRTVTMEELNNLWK